MSIFLPKYKPKATISRPSAERVNQLQPQKQKLTVAGRGEIVPLVYGRAEVAGPIIGGPIDRESGTVAYYAIALSHGPITRIVNSFVGSDKKAVNKTPNAAGVYHVVSGDGYSYECMFYDGTQKGVDPRLAANISNFGDTFEGIAYVSIKMTGENANIGDVHFEIQGRKVLDPRTGVISYSENPALHMHDFVTNQKWGLRRGMIGTEKLADECDRILAYGPKSRVNNVVVSSADETGLLEIFAMYAEALYGYSGGDVIVVPDSAVQEKDIIEIPASQIRMGSIKLSSRSAENIPSSITLEFDTTDDDGLAGSPAYVSVEQTDPSDPVINSTVTVRGVYRRDESQRRANQRLALLRTPGRVAFQMFDSGAYMKVGNVVRMPNTYGIEGSEFRLTSNPTMVSVGVYQLSGEAYEARNYYAPVGTTNLPKDVVIFMLDDVDPLDTEKLTDLGLVRGKLAGGIETTGEDDKLFNARQNRATTAPAGQHSGTNWVAGFNSIYLQRVIENGYGWWIRDVLEAKTTPDHVHQVTRSGNQIGTALYDRLNMRAHRVTKSLNKIPNGTIFFARESFLDNIYFNKVLAEGLLSVANNEAIGAIGRLSFESSVSGKHTHFKYQSAERWPAPSQGGYLELMENPRTLHSPSGGADGEHDHDVELVSNAPDKLKTKGVFAYTTKTTQSRIPEGAIFGFLGLGPVPSDWALCDGNNGTIDLTDSFIGVNISDSTGATALPTITATGVALKPSGGHSHDGKTEMNSSSLQGLMTHDETEDHVHPINMPGFPITVTPRYTKIRFIQYIGEQ